MFIVADLVSLRNKNDKKQRTLIWTRQNLSSGFLTKLDSNQPAQLQRLDRKLKFRSYQVKV